MNEETKPQEESKKLLSPMAGYVQDASPLFFVCVLLLVVPTCVLGFWLCSFVVFWLRLCLWFRMVVVVDAVLTSCLPRVSSGFVFLFSCCCDAFPCAQHLPRG
jgi:hypothetical protein